MDRTKRKARLERIADELYLATSREADLMKEMLNLLIEEAKDNLVTAEDVAMRRWQGEARAFTRLFEMVTIKSPTKRGQ